MVKRAASTGRPPEAPTADPMLHPQPQPPKHQPKKTKRVVRGLLILEQCREPEGRQEREDVGLARAWIREFARWYDAQEDTRADTRRRWRERNGIPASKGEEPQGDGPKTTTAGRPRQKASRGRTKR